MTKRSMIYVTDKEQKQLDYLSQEMELSISNVVRLAIGSYYAEVRRKQWKISEDDLRSPRPTNPRKK